MTNESDPPSRRPRYGFETRLSNVGRAGLRTLGFVNPPLVRGSTVLQPSCAARVGSAEKTTGRSLTYGIHGTPTHFALEDAICEIEGGTHCQIVSSGLAAITTPLLAVLKGGDHVLIPDSVYGPTRRFCNTMLARMGITTTFYRPTIDATGLAALIGERTSVLFLESPGSHTFEVQDVPALAAAAHARGLVVMMDNTWGIRFFQPFRHGVDISIQALTKYVAGHSDVLLGSVTVADDAIWETLKHGVTELGQYASPDDCWLALRGVRTLAVRLDRQMQSALTVARWLVVRPEVAQVLHPALPGAPGHELWKRDFTGACSLFGVEFTAGVTEAQVMAMIDALELFGIGASWGGYESLALPSNASINRTLDTGLAGQVARFHVGLEDPADLIADLERAFALLHAG